MHAPDRNERALNDRVGGKTDRPASTVHPEIPPPRPRVKRDGVSDDGDNGDGDGDGDDDVDVDFDVPAPAPTRALLKKKKLTF